MTAREEYTTFETSLATPQSSRQRINTTNKRILDNRCALVRVVCRPTTMIDLQIFQWHMTIFRWRKTIAQDSYARNDSKPKKKIANQKTQTNFGPHSSSHHLKACEMKLAINRLKLSIHALKWPRVRSCWWSWTRSLRYRAIKDLARTLHHELRLHGQYIYSSIADTQCRRLRTWNAQLLHRIQ